MEVQLRKLVTCPGEVRIEGGRSAAQRLCGPAMVRNPWIRCGYVEDLRAENHAHSPLLGRLLTNEMLRLARPGEAVEGGGKAAMVGTTAEIEHTSALICTLRFGDYFRRTPGASIGGPPQHRHGERGNIHG